MPTVVFTLHNISDQKLVTLQVNALFRRVTENTEWGSGFLTVVGSQGLAPGATTDPITIKSQLGYTGSDQSRQEMLQNSAVRRRQGRAVREVRIDPVGQGRRVSDYASADVEVRSAARVSSASAPSLIANSRNDRGECRIDVVEQERRGARPLQQRSHDPQIRASAG